MRLKDLGKKILYNPKFSGYADNSKVMQVFNKVIDLTLGVPFHLRACWMYGRQYGFKMLSAKNNKKMSDVYMLTIVKDEGEYIQEWILYHYLMGIKHFLIYNNESSDDTVQKIKQLDESLTDLDINLINWPGQSQQRAAYANAIERFHDIDCWVLTLDADEFLYLKNHQSISDYLRDIPNNVSQVLIGWLIYGSNNFIKRPKGLVIDNYSRHAKESYITDYKTLTRSQRLVRPYSAHFFMTLDKTVDAAGKRHWFYPFSPMRGAVAAPKDKVRVNHYYDKSKEDLELKIKRGDVFNVNKATRNQHNFVMQDRNEVKDHDMDEISARIHALMKKIHIE